MKYIAYTKEKIRKSGGRITKTKLSVINILASLEKPMNAYRIAEAIKESGGKIDVVTVYRILESFEQLGLVHKSEKGFVPCSNLDCSNKEHCHHQFFCDKCERAFEVHISDNEFIESVKRKFEDFAIKSHDFRFSGLCDKCQ